jgi:hypothetical protein
MESLPLSDLESFWQNPKFNDVDVLVIEKGSREQDLELQASKRARCSEREEAKHIRVGCAKFILAARSAYFKTLLESDMYTGDKELLLVVEEGEADAALAVIKAMYGIADDVTAAQFVTMWKIADRLQADIADLCVKALRAKDMEWDTALSVSKPTD